MSMAIYILCIYNCIQHFLKQPNELAKAASCENQIQLFTVHAVKKKKHLPYTGRFYVNSK